MIKAAKIGVDECIFLFVVQLTLLMVCLIRLQEFT